MQIPGRKFGGCPEEHIKGDDLGGLAFRGVLGGLMESTRSSQKCWYEPAVPVGLEAEEGQLLEPIT